jgi:hypothetical protein
MTMRLAIEESVAAVVSTLHTRIDTQLSNTGVHKVACGGCSCLCALGRSGCAYEDAITQVRLPLYHHI